MGITIIQKSDLTKKKTNAKTALVLAGGAVSGGAFKVGGLKALNDFLVNRKVTDFDIYLGISAGAFLAAPLAGGIGPETMLESLDGTSEDFFQLSPLHLYWPNYKEWIFRPVNFFYQHLTFVPGMIYDVFSTLPRIRKDFSENLREFIKNPTYSNYQKLTKPLFKAMYGSRSMPSLGSLLPSGLCDNKRLGDYIRGNMERNHLTNNFKILKKVRGKSLYIVAMDLDSSQRVIFGYDEKNDVSISDAVQASSCIPGFYKPARVKGIDYIDGGVRRTASIDVAIDKGAELIICYNPFRPFFNQIELEYIREQDKYVTKNKRMADQGLLMIFNQVFRTLFHSRLEHAIKLYETDPAFQGDIILIEPKEDDTAFFEMNPLTFWNRAKAARLGFESVRRSIAHRYPEIKRILNSYGIEMSDDKIQADISSMARSGYRDETVMTVLEKDAEAPRPALRVVGGR